ncbi:DUF4158 domain-containing protein [Brevibacillus sp. NRRL NRS-603]|uniref:DUF4158 domain-containing protein n=1 Tax=Brevibacillus TaxID=55080 RepID=UPI00130504D7
MISPGYESTGHDEPPNFLSKSLYRHQSAIREYLKVTPYGKHALRTASSAIYRAAQVMDNPADLINVGIAEMIKERCELKAFSTLDRLARRIRTMVNHQFFHVVLNRLTSDDKNTLDQLLMIPEDNHHSPYNDLKDVPKSPTKTHFQDLQTRLSWLSTLGDVERLLEGIPPAKVKHFAAEARALDIAEIKDFSPPKRYIILLSMIYRARVTTRDHLVDMFLKRVALIHKRGKEDLELLREQHRSKTEYLISVFTEVLQASGGTENDARLGKQVRELLVIRGGIQSLLDVCDAVSPDNGNNYLPLLWKFCRQNRHWHDECRPNERLRERNTYSLDAGRVV